MAKVSEKRKALIASVAYTRQPNVVVIVENIEDTHNISAIMRTCDAVGISKIHAVLDPRLHHKQRLQPGKFASSGARKWVDVLAYNDLASCIADVRKEVDKVYATVFQPGSKSYESIDYTQSLGIILGNEKFGVSPQAQALSDGLIYIPQHGFTQSLNLSVSCAIILYEMQRQRQHAGMYAPGYFGELQEAIFQDYIQRQQDGHKFNPFVRQ